MTPELLDEYVKLARRHNEPNDGSKGWVRRVNRAAKRMQAIADSLLLAPDPDVVGFASLLESQEERARTWAAHHLLDVAERLEPSLVERALAIIEASAAGDSLNAFGERMWLDDWYARVKPD